MLTTAEMATTATWTTPGAGLRSAVIVTIVSAIIFGIAIFELIRGNLSTVLAELSAAIALVSFGFAVYGVLRMILSLIETAGERRRHRREVTERRRGERARKRD